MIIIITPCNCEHYSEITTAIAKCIFFWSHFVPFLRFSGQYPPSNGPTADHKMLWSDSKDWNCIRTRSSLASLLHSPSPFMYWKRSKLEFPTRRLPVSSLLSGSRCPFHCHVSTGMALVPMTLVSPYKTRTLFAAYSCPWTEPVELRSTKVTWKLIHINSNLQNWAESLLCLLPWVLFPCPFQINYSNCLTDWRDCIDWNGTGWTWRKMLWDAFVLIFTSSNNSQQCLLSGTDLTCVSIRPGAGVARRRLRCLQGSHGKFRCPDSLVSLPSMVLTTWPVSNGQQWWTTWYQCRNHEVRGHRQFRSRGEVRILPEVCLLRHYEILGDTGEIKNTMIMEG